MSVRSRCSPESVIDNTYSDQEQDFQVAAYREHPAPIILPTSINVVKVLLLLILLEGKRVL